MYEEAGSDFHQVAYFKTRIGLRNALREEISGSSDREAVLITLNRPIVFAQPVAFDRGTAGFCVSISILEREGGRERITANLFCCSIKLVSSF